MIKKYPHKVAEITTLGTKFKWTKEIAAQEVKMLNPEIIALKLPNFATLLKERHGAQWKSLFVKTAEMMLEMGAENPLKPSDFSSIKHSINMLLAANDEMVGQEETLEIHRLLSNSAFNLIPNSKHPIEKVELEVLAIEIEKMY